MKKTGKLFGMMAITTALALGTAMPAFAAEKYGVDVSGEKSTATEQGGSVATDVKIATRVTNINVAVPLTVTIVADSGSGDVLAPSAGLKNYTAGALSSTTGYRIENYSPFPVKVSNIETKDTSDGKWALLSASDVTDGTLIDDATMYGRTGDLLLKLVPSDPKNEKEGANQVALNEGNQRSNQVIDLGEVLEAGVDPDWAIARKASSTEPAIMGLTLSGSNSILRNINEGSILWGTDEEANEADESIEAENAFQIIYTVSATSLNDTL